MSDIFREVEEDIRSAQLKALWDRYGILVISLAVAIVIGTALVVYWQDVQRQKREAAATMFLEAEQMALDGKPAEAVARFEKLARESGIKGYALLSRMKEAATRLETNDRAGAIAAYDALAADTGVDTLLREVASLKAALLLYDTASADELRLRLNPLARDDSAVRHSAKEALAFLALRDNAPEDARKQFQQLADALDAPPGVRGRAAEILNVLPAAPAAPAPSSLPAK